MSYTTPPTVSEGDAWTANYHNTYIRDNFAVSPAAIATTNGDIFPAAASQACTRLAAGTNGQALTADSAQATGMKYAAHGLAPVGGIVIYSGAVANIPANWQICDGTNGTPNLADRFILAGDGTNTGTTGGAASLNLQHSHALTSPTVSGTHTHTQGVSGAGGSHTHAGGTTADNSQSDTWGTNEAGSAKFAALHHTHGSSGASGAESSHTHSNPSTDADSGHTHTLSSTTSSNALSTTQDIRPPYYALCYVMRLT